ncbi:hypothetical protein [Salipaludibacillus keqinensis]|nr:hypothetical protein [Salipaludibacillus keqinensis]
MLKKMFISMMTMTILIISGFMFLFQGSVDGTLGMPDSPIGEKMEKSFEDESYVYYLNDEQILSAIEKGVTSTELIDDFLLDKSEVTELQETDVAFAYVETPYLTVLKESRNIFDRYGRRPVPQELKPELMDQFLPVHIRFYENKGYVYNVKVLQEDHEVEYFRRETRGSGSMKTLYVKVDDLDFSERAIVQVEDKIDPSINHSFYLDFQIYKP